MGESDGAQGKRTVADPASGFEETTVGPPRSGAVDPAIDETRPLSAQGEHEPAARGCVASRDEDPLCGAKLHHFRVIERIGQGGMGTVYRAHDLSLDRFVALKVLSPDALRDPTLRERFLREARAQAKLAHPNVVPIYYIGEQEGTHFFAMEWVAGESLEVRLARGEPLEPAAALQQMTCIASALKLAHKRGFIHRDIKPSNLLVDETGTVKVADFGLARPVAEHAQLTQTGAILGTPLYMSPEQAQGEEVDHRADIYSLGATYYHLLTGTPPFSAATPLGVITKHLTQPLPPVRSRAPKVDAEVAAVIERMLAKDRDNRYQDYDALLDAVDGARPSAIAPAGFWVRAMAFGADVTAMLLLGVFIGRLAWLVYPLHFIGGWWRFGQSAGKWLFKLKVCAMDHQPLTLGQCVRRFVALNWVLFVVLAIKGIQWGTGMPTFVIEGKVSSLAELWQKAAPQLCLGAAFGVAVLAYLGTMISVGFRRDRRGIHDRLSNTRVVYALEKRPAAPARERSAAAETARVR